MSWYVFSRKSAGKEQSEAFASASISSSTPLTKGRTPTFSSNSAWLGVSNKTLAGWNAIGLHSVSQCMSVQHEECETHPIMRSYCCCRMFWDTLQSTCPELKVMARASAMSDWICGGMFAFLLAGPTQMFVAPLCSNSLAPSCEISAPDTNESTTFVGKRCSRYDSTPRLCVVFIRMHVC